ncbi:substrate-binding periplasmic protein [Roseibium sediminicola]|uniref:Transporter substrate-binding domain-containing protein n=1 Tax=Roseibium sediminicola TaxID=2933272 RepID=A0ABT0GST1_9HYPH|nr:transporter substrate-binding domain-containing protein [Roseibium sp. CAU 1639]MCK7612132.1 transporter substrate-binding domain-containing protein [Roseibium sp. CAU 1639]
MSGFDYEVVIETFARTGWLARIAFVPWKRAVAVVPAGLLSCAYRAQREEFAFYSEQLSSTTDGVYYRSDFADDQNSSHADLIGKKVGAVTGYSTHAKLTDFGIDPIDIPNGEAGIKMLEHGRLDNFLNGRQATDFLIKWLGLSGRFRFSIMADKPLFLCLSKAFPLSNLLLEDFNKGLAEVKADGTYA